MYCRLYILFDGMILLVLISKAASMVLSWTSCGIFSSPVINPRSGEQLLVLQLVLANMHLVQGGRDECHLN